MSSCQEAIISFALLDYKLSLLLLQLLILQYYRPAQNRAKVSFDVRNIAFKKKA